MLRGGYQQLKMNQCLSTDVIVNVAAVKRSFKGEKNSPHARARAEYVAEAHLKLLRFSGIALAMKS